MLFKRVVPYFYKEIIPEIKKGKKILVVAHGNSIRGLIKYFDKLTDEEIVDMDIPNAVPLVYEFNENFETIKRYYLGGTLMQFIIPYNYKFKTKLLGLLDYQTAVIDGIWAGILFLLSNLIFTSLTHKLYFIVALFLPVLLFTIIGVNNESVISVTIYIFKYFKRQKIFLYKKKK